MNYDRFLIRVWDKENKVMLYPGDKFNISSEDVYYQGVNGSCLLITSLACNNLGIPVSLLNQIPFGNRFIPMLCSGQKDQNEKLIYGSDIVKICDGVDCSYHEIVWGYDYPAFDIFPLLYDDCNSLQAALTELFVEVVDNKWEHPALWKENKDE